ncbi:cyclohexanone monooxygenase [Nocardioides sp. Root190]|uniref:flavin-containing monooxygenase n=1 Tax=Nocardioides sp. Root190 TaxID=1736488 RepID=UPI0006FCE83B|nr:NAD(P)/FAD-dependent oxidoreductase [Nocardioides sp. Root190]KRB75090.1 cyclohexanone monooxygenase [Nocardioides sp. Root190]
MTEDANVVDKVRSDDGLDYEFLIIGAGVCGLYQLHRLLEIGAKATALEANSDVGGTWYNNRYPGCRFDSESYTYQYSFDKELLGEWNWSERFAAQPETLRYFQHVAEKFGLRKHIQFNSRVVSAVYNENNPSWLVTTAGGATFTTRFLMTAMGLLSAPTVPRFEGRDTFGGTSLHTFDWPHAGLDLAGKRVGVVGTGATGVQVISTIADKVKTLTVFQRDANWCAPLGNAPISEPEMAQLKETYDEIFERCFNSPNGFLHRPDRRISTDVSREERLAWWEELYGAPGFGIWLGNFRDTLMNEDANAELSEFIAAKVRARVDDPAVAEKLIPHDHGFGTKRVPLETRYYEVYNRPNVRLVDLMETPVERVTPSGITTTAEDIELDVIIYATGFDAVTGPFDRIDFVGENGLKLRDKWKDGPETCVGVQTTGFPNLLTCVGPQSGSVAANFPRGIEDIVAWMTDFAIYIRENGVTEVRANREAELAWVEHVREVNQEVLFTKTKSWFNGYNLNVDGGDKPRVLIYTGGAVRYRKRLAEERAAGYPSFEILTGDALPESS